MRKVVYTCVTNNIDNLEDPKFILDDCQYICYTDNHKKSNIWEFKPLIKKFSYPRLTARFHKTIGQNYIDADIIIWQDGKITFLSDYSYLFETNSIKLIPHQKRNCIYKEAMKVIQLGKCEPLKAKLQISAYKQTGFPNNQGLFETSIVIRNNKQNELNEMWWNEIQNHTIRDQISLPYVLWKMNLNPEILLINYLKNDLFYITHHESTDEYIRMLF